MEDTRFNKLRYPIHKHPKDADYKKLFPELFRHEEFTCYRKKDLNTVVRYIIFLYDPRSPFIEEFQQLEERKYAAAIEAGWKRIYN